MREPFQSSGSKQYQLRYKLTAYRSDISPEFHRTEIDDHLFHGTTVVFFVFTIMAEYFWFRYFLHREGLIENRIHLVSIENSYLLTHACQIVLVEDKLVLLLANGLFSVVYQILFELMNRS